MKNQFDEFEKEIITLSYQEKQLYLKILNDKYEVSKIIVKLKSLDNFFLNLIDIEIVDILGLVRLDHNLTYGQLNINSCIKLKKKNYIEMISNMIAEDTSYYFKYLDLNKFSLDDIKVFFIEFYWKRDSIIKILKTKDIFYFKYIDFNFLTDNELEELLIQTSTTLEDDWVEKIQIWSNEFKLNLPENKDDLLSLDKIIANDTNIKYIPKEIGKLQNLIEINFSNINMSVFDDNIIKEVPPEIYNLPYLSKLNLSNNKIKNIPNGIYKLSNLRELDISNNDIVEIPEEISRLISLKELYLSNSGLVSISKRIFTKSIINIPKKFTNLQYLTILDDKNDYRKSTESISDFFIRKNYTLA